ncbi:hypothetical protein BS78_01G127100 [Paspalum vaginatum]|nr:hypothetical protein BS78_01G127100 [Paspalum vaginatum]
MRNECIGNSVLAKDGSDFWECYIWATASEVLGREAAAAAAAAARGCERRPDWFNLKKPPVALCRCVD